MKVVADELVRLARTSVETSVAVSEGWSGSYAGLTPPDTAAGDTLQGPSFVAAAARAAEAADLFSGRLVSTLQEDADDLLRVAFDVTAVDEATAAELESEPLRRVGAA